MGHRFKPCWDHNLSERKCTLRYTFFLFVPRCLTASAPVGHAVFVPLSAGICAASISFRNLADAPMRRLMAGRSLPCHRTPDAFMQRHLPRWGMPPSLRFRRASPLLRFLRNLADVPMRCLMAPFFSTLCFGSLSFRPSEASGEIYTHTAPPGPILRRGRFLFRWFGNTSMPYSYL